MSENSDNDKKIRFYVQARIYIYIYFESKTTKIHFLRDLSDVFNFSTVIMTPLLIVKMKSGSSC